MQPLIAGDWNPQGYGGNPITGWRCAGRDDSGQVMRAPAWWRCSAGRSPAARRLGLHAARRAPADLPAGPGRDETFYACAACHGFRIVAQQGQSRPQWDDTLDWMTKRHNMPALDGNDRQRVLDYLETTYPPRTAPRGWQNPFQR